MSEKKSPDEKPIIRQPLEKAQKDSLGDVRNRIRGEQPLIRNNDPGEKITRPTEIRDKHEE